MVRGLRNKKREWIRHYNGKVFKGDGPYYVPSGATWAEIDQMVKDYRAKGYNVRVDKTKETQDTFLTRVGNTHTVWLYVRKKAKKGK